MDTVVCNLTEINVVLKELYKDYQIFKDNYDEWVFRRERTISVFRKLRDEIDNIHVCSSTARAVSSGVSVLGGLATIAGLALTFSNNENLRQLGKNMTKNGSFASVLGTASTATTSLIEVGLNKVKVDEAKVCLEEDIKYTRKLMPGLRNVNNLDALFQKVFGCSILTNTWQDICIVLEKMMVLKEKGAYTFKEIEEILSSGVKNVYSDVVAGYNKNNSLYLEEKSKKIQSLNDKTKLILKEFCSNLEVRKAVEEMYKSLKRSPVIFEMFQIKVRSRFDLKMLHKMAMYILPEFVSVADNIAVDVLNAMYQGILVAVKISIDVIVFISAVDDISKRKSCYSELLKNTEFVLNEELKIIKKAYSALNK